MTNDFFIQKLGPTDVVFARQLFEVFLLFQRDEGLAEPQLPPDAHFNRLLNRDDFHAIAAIRSGQVIGGLTAYELRMFQENTTELFIYDIAVNAEHRRQGVATALIGFVKTLCIARDIKAFYVGAMTDESDAVQFYESTNLKRENVAWFIREF